MLRKIPVLSCLIFVLLFGGCDSSETQLIITDSTTSKGANINPAKSHEDGKSKPRILFSPSDVVEISVREDGAPGMYLGDDGELHGFYVDLEKMIMEEMGQAYYLRSYSDVGPVIQGLKSGAYHIALAVPDLPDFRVVMNLSIPYEVLHFVTFVQSGNSDIQGETREELLKSLYGKKIGVQTRGHIYQVLRDIREIELVEYPTTTKALADLNKGLLDAVPDVERIGKYYAVLNSWNIKPVGKPIISHKLTTGFSQVIDKALIERYNNALNSLIADGRFDVLRTSYFGPTRDEDRP